MNKIQIHLVSTGGTIEKSYDELDGTLANRTSIIKDKIIASLRMPHAKIKYHQIMAKDSLDLDDNDRQEIFEYIEHLHTSKEPIIILHGTDTLTVTYKYLKNKLKSPQSTIVMTGAMRPLGFERTDALQNVTEALVLSQVLNPGVYISFHSKLFSALSVKKDKRLRTFVEG